MEAPPVPAKRGRSPIPLVAAAGLGVAVLGAAIFILGKGPDANQTQTATPSPGPAPSAGPPTTPGTTTAAPPSTGPSTGPTATKAPPATGPSTGPAPTGGLQVGGLKLVNVPPGSTTTIDGDAISDPGKERYLPAGPHVVVVEAKGFLPFRSDVEVAVGQVKQVEVALKPQPTVPKGTLEINCQPWCQITVDKKDSGKTSPAKLVLAAGPHTLLLANPPAGLAKTIQVVVPENGVVTKVVQLEE